MLSEEQFVEVKKNYEFKDPRRRYYAETESFCEGGPELYNGDFGLFGHVWHLTIEGVAKDEIFVAREDLGVKTKIFTRAGIEDIDFTFDQNMRPFVVYTVGGKPFYYHFDALTSTYSEVALPTDIRFPRVDIDHRQVKDIPQSDIILGYVRNGNLYYRMQRERYLKEHLVLNGNRVMCWRVGECADGRFGFQWR